MKTGELPLSITGYNTQESGTYTCSEQHSSARLGQGGAGELSLRIKQGETLLCHSSTVRYHGCRNGALYTLHSSIPLGVIIDGY